MHAISLSTIVCTNRVVSRMIHATEEECEAIAKKLAELLEIDEAGWERAARWIDRLALEDGLDLCAEWESPQEFATSVVTTLRWYIDMERFSDGLASVHDYDVAEELFWTIFPDWRRSGL